MCACSWHSTPPQGGVTCASESALAAVPVGTRNTAASLLEQLRHASRRPGQSIVAIAQREAVIGANERVQDAGRYGGGIIAGKFHRDCRASERLAEPAIALLRGKFGSVRAARIRLFGRPAAERIKIGRMPRIGGCRLLSAVLKFGKLTIGQHYCPTLRSRGTAGFRANPEPGAHAVRLGIGSARLHTAFKGAPAIRRARAADAPSRDAGPTWRLNGGAETGGGYARGKLQGERRNERDGPEGSSGSGARLRASDFADSADPGMPAASGPVRSCARQGFLRRRLHRRYQGPQVASDRRGRADDPGQSGASRRGRRRSARRRRRRHPGADSARLLRQARPRRSASPCPSPATMRSASCSCRATQEWRETDPQDLRRGRRRRKA